jgi:predicted nucleic acid-binding protein
VIVVSDTGPLNYLVLIGCTEILPQLYSVVYAPPGVFAELNHAKTPAVVVEWMGRRPAWLVERAPTRAEAVDELGVGESQALGLARELECQALVDDGNARRIARSMGVPTLGLLGLLGLAAEYEHVDLLAALDRLARTSFRAPRELIAQMRDAERRRRGS